MVNTGDPKPKRALRERLGGAFSDVVSGLVRVVGWLASVVSRLARCELDKLLAWAGVIAGGLLILADVIFFQILGSVEVDSSRPSTWDHAVTLLFGVVLLLGGPVLAMLFSRGSLVQASEKANTSSPTGGS